MLASIFAFAQKAQVKEGNKLYQEQKYKEAAAAYQRSLEKDPKYAPGSFNLGNALYKQKNYEGARQAMTTTTKISKDKQVTADANYNIGNTYMEEKKWQEAVNAYKETLRRNPQDEQAKYNLSYALAMLKKQQGGGGKNDQNKDQQNKDQNKDQQNKDQQQEDQQDQQQNKDEQKDEQPQPQPSKLSKEQADQLLNALSQEEKKLHDKKEKGKAVRIKVEKDW